MSNDVNAGSSEQDVMHSNGDVLKLYDGDFVETLVIIERILRGDDNNPWFINFGMSPDDSYLKRSEFDFHQMEKLAYECVADALKVVGVTSDVAEFINDDFSLFVKCDRNYRGLAVISVSASLRRTFHNSSLVNCSGFTCLLGYNRYDHSLLSKAAVIVHYDNGADDELYVYLPDGGGNQKLTHAGTLTIPE